ncbi:MAG: AAA family ATPase [Bacteroidales bacterium]|nr:AAA family ATPase [Bacteroidales bacterium]
MFSYLKGHTIAKYTVAFPIKDSTYAETYRVKDASGKNYFLKLFNYAKLHYTQFDEYGEVLELVISKQLNHPNLTHYHDSGELVLGGQKMAYIVYDFISGETLAQKTGRERGCSVYEAKQYVSGVLEGVKFLHSFPNPVIHNELTTENVMLDMKDNTPKMIDFGHARFLSQNRSAFQKDGLNPYYMAPEAYNGVFTVQSDLYSVGAMLYQLLFGMPPYYVSLPQYQADRDSIVDILLHERQKPLPMLIKDKPGLDEQLVNTLRKALSNDVDDRFKNADEFISALNNEMMVEAIPSRNKAKTKTQETGRPKTGNGFADVAGMDELKEQMRLEVIDALNEPERYKEYGITIPNGMLLYGPPGCGKTFFAKKFAEEVGFNFMVKTPADLKSRYVNATQENIKAMFAEAYENAPTIIFIDEINELVPNRSGNIHEMAESAVNEMLSQMDRTGEKGVFIIGASNLPQKIDPAILRAGRLEKHYYVGPPDFTARKLLFEKCLQKRKAIDFGIDYEVLANMTEYYVSADIQLIVDDAARKALYRMGKITMQILEETVRNKIPSLSYDQIIQYENIRDMFGSITTKPSDKPKIGFIK